MGAPRIAVTGCAGYIGAVLTGRLLAAGCRVVGIDNLLYDNAAGLQPYLGDRNFEFWSANVVDFQLVRPLIQSCDVIVPLAALVGAPICDKKPFMAAAVNFDAIGIMMRYVSPNQRVIFTQTNSGYGQTDGTSFVTEDDALLPISHYGKTKCLAETEVLKHPNSVSLRLATVFGVSPRMRFDLMVNDFTQKIAGTGGIEIFEPHFKRNFVHIRDVCNAILFMVGKPHLTGVFNVGDPSANMTKMELAHTICDSLKMSREGITVGTGTDSDQRNYLVSNEKLLKTGFQFQHTLTDGIRSVAGLCRLLTTDQIREMRNV